jgi:hypothetical protein
MNGYLALRVIAYFALGIGIGILSHPAWGFIAFGVLILLDNFVLGRMAPTLPERPVVREDYPERDR